MPTTEEMIHSLFILKHKTINQAYFVPAPFEQPMEFSTLINIPGTILTFTLWKVVTECVEFRNRGKTGENKKQKKEEQKE